MRLGYTGTAYRYQGAARHGLVGRDQVAVDGRTTAQYDWRGLPAPYHQPAADWTGEQSPELGDVNRAAHLGLSVVHTVVTDWSTRNTEALRAALRAGGQELVPTVGANMMLEGELLDAELSSSAELMRRYGELGGVRVSKLMVSPMTVNRFRNDPPLDEQLRRITTALPPIVRAAEEAGIVLAFENHLDYRVTELLEVICAIDSPNLRLLFDTGNPFAVCEDPVEAARAAASYTVLIHVKDVRVLPWTPLSPGYFACMYICPLGEGNVDLDAIISIMAEQAPSPASLTLALEIRPVPPYFDEDRWLEDGIEFMNRRFARYLTPAPPPS
jgi:sugar phosphate isomerase/epimerase